MEHLSASAAFLLIIGGAYATFWVLKRSSQRNQVVERLWKLLADRLEGRFVQPKGLFSPGSGPHVVADIDGARVTVMEERSALGEKRAPVPVTRISADAVGTAGLELHVFPEDAFTQMTKALGAQDVLIGDDDFDEKFVIKTNNADLARVWLDDEARRRIEESEPYRFSVARGELRASHDGLDENIRRVESTVRNVAFLAGAGARLMERTRAVATELEGLFSAVGESWGTKGAVLIVLERLGAQVLIDFVSGAVDASMEGIFTRIRLRSALALEERYLVRGARGCPAPPELDDLPEVTLEAEALVDHYQARAEDAGMLRDRLSRPLVERITKLDPALVAGNGQEITVCLAGVILESPVLEEAIELGLELATTEPTGPYR